MVYTLAEKNKFNEVLSVFKRYITEHKSFVISFIRIKSATLWYLFLLMRKKQQ